MVAPFVPVVAGEDEDRARRTGSGRARSKRPSQRSTPRRVPYMPSHWALILSYDFCPSSGSSRTYGGLSDTSRSLYAGDSKDPGARTSSSCGAGDHVAVRCERREVEEERLRPILDLRRAQEPTRLPPEHVGRVVVRAGPVRVQHAVVVGPIVVIAAIAADERMPRRPSDRCRRRVARPRFEVVQVFAEQARGVARLLQRQRDRPPLVVPVAAEERSIVVATLRAEGPPSAHRLAPEAVRPHARVAREQSRSGSSRGTGSTTGWRRTRDRTMCRARPGRGRGASSGGCR